MRGDLNQLVLLGIQHHESGRLAEAEAIYRRIVALSPDDANALHLLGVLSQQSGRPDQAVDLISRAIAIKPTFPAYHVNLCLVLATQGRLDQAIAAARRGLALDPNAADAKNALATALTCQGDVLIEQGDYARAADAFRGIIAIRPSDHPAHNNLANALWLSGHLDTAEQSARNALALSSHSPESHLTLANILAERGQTDAAIAELRQALKLRPDYPQAHWRLGLILLARGDFENGFPEYEYRWLCPKLGFHRREFPQPLWDGSPLSGKKILLHVEQRFGDTIQFARYAPLVTQLGGHVILLCEGELHRLLQRAPGIAQVITPADPLPDFEVHYPLSSLPALLKTTLQNIPATIPYLFPDPWPTPIPADGRLKVGLAWSGNPQPNRSIPPEFLVPLAQLPNIHFFSLQKGEAPRPPIELTDWTAALKDFADTASLIWQLDLVITIDTAVAHLAGALGKPVWLLLLHGADWRWLLDRTDSPWYPTMRLFRQPRAGDWQSPISNVRETLRQLAR